MKELGKNTVILTAITLVAGVLLGLVYQITQKPIENAQKAAEDAACREVFAEAEAFDANIGVDADAASETLKDHQLTAEEIDAVRVALDKKEEPLGYVITVTTTEGYGGAISFMVGVRLDGKVNGISILSISETAGLGMRAKEPEFLKQFEEKQAESFTYSKSGASADNEIDAITGATITTNAMTNGVNAALFYFQDVLKEGE